MKSKFRPTADVLEDRRLMSFGGGNIDTSIPRYASTSPGLNFTSNSFHQINATIPDVASTILKSTSSTHAQLANYVAHIPYGVTSLLPTLEADVAAFQKGTTTTTTTTTSTSITTAAANSIVTTLYEGLLQRKPDAFGLSAASQALQNGASLAQVADVIVQSTEFFQSNTTVGQSGNANQVEFVSALYQDVLGRSGSVDELTGWLNQINYGGASLQQIAHNFVYSAEASSSSSSILHSVAASSIYSLYAGLLERSPGSAELEAGVKVLEGGNISVPQLADFLVQSPEFYQNNTTVGQSGNANQVEFVSALYIGVLGRDPDLAGLTGWVNAINFGGLSLQQVAHNFVYSAEAATLTTSILQKAAYPGGTVTTTVGTVTPSGPITGNFPGTSKLAQLENLIQRDTLTYLAAGIGTKFNILKSGVGWASDSLLTYNGRV